MVHMGRVPAAQARGCHGLSVGGLFVGLNDFMDACKARLDDILQDIGTKTLKYLYDFGDGWEHTIKIERLVDPKPGMLYPSLIEAKGHCPPEDVGGPGAIANSSRPSPILTTGATASSKNGSQTTSILMLTVWLRTFEAFFFNRVAPMWFVLALAVCGRTCWPARSLMCPGQRFICSSATRRRRSSCGSFACHRRAGCCAFVRHRRYAVKQ